MCSRVPNGSGDALDRLQRVGGATVDTRTYVSRLGWPSSPRPNGAVPSRGGYRGNVDVWVAVLFGTIAQPHSRGQPYQLYIYSLSTRSVAQQFYTSGATTTSIFHDARLPALHDLASMLEVPSRVIPRRSCWMRTALARPDPSRSPIPTSRCAPCVAVRSCVGNIARVRRYFLSGSRTAAVQRRTVRLLRPISRGRFVNRGRTCSIKASYWLARYVVQRIQAPSFSVRTAYA